MSVGLSGMTPEEEAQLAALQPGQEAVNGVPTPPGPAPAPGMPPVDTGPPPAPGPSSFPGTDQAAAAVGAVGQPPAPGAPSAAPLPGVPSAAPAPAAPAAPPPPDALGDLKKAQDEEARARADHGKAVENLQKAQQAGVESQQRIADQKVKDEQEDQRRRAEIVQRYQSAEAAANKQIADTQAAIKGFKFRDYFAKDDGTGVDWPRKIGMAFASAIGAFGSGLTHGPNFALQILNQDMSDAHQAQVDHLGQLKDEDVMTRTGLHDAQAAREKALADINVAGSARDKLVAAQLEQVAAQQRSASFAPSLVEAAQKLRLDAAEKDTAAKKSLVELNVKLQDEGRKAHLDEASITEKESLAKLHDAQTAAGGFSPRHAKGGGGGGGGAGRSAGVEELTGLIAGGKPYPELVAAANRLHVPLEGKAGVVSLKSLIAGTGSAGKLDASGDKAATHALDKLAPEFNKDLSETGVVAGQGGAKGLLPTNRTLQKLLAAVDSGNPLSAKEAFLAFDAAARGGTATQSSIDALTKTLGGSYDQFKNWLESKATGGLAEPSKARFREAIKEAISSNVQAAGGAHDQMVRKYYAPDYYGLKQNVESQMGIFEGFRGPDGKPVFHLRRDEHAPGLNRATGKALPAGAAAGTQGGPPAGADMVTIRNKAGHTKRVTREEARALGAIP